MNENWSATRFLWWKFLKKKKQQNNLCMLLVVNIFLFYLSICPWILRFLSGQLITLSVLSKLSVGYIFSFCLFFSSEISFCQMKRHSFAFKPHFFVRTLNGFSFLMLFLQKNCVCPIFDCVLYDSFEKLSTTGFISFRAFGLFSIVSIKSVFQFYLKDLPSESLPIKNLLIM